MQVIKQELDTVRQEALAKGEPTESDQQHIQELEAELEAALGGVMENVASEPTAPGAGLASLLPGAAPQPPGTAGSKRVRAKKPLRPKPPRRVAEGDGGALNSEIWIARERFMAQLLDPFWQTTIGKAVVELRSKYERAKDELQELPHTDREKLQEVLLTRSGD